MIKVAELCCEWNTTKDYNAINLNCQHFSLKLLEILGCDFNQLGPPIKEYFDQLSKGERKYKFRGLIF